MTDKEFGRSVLQQDFPNLRIKLEKGDLSAAEVYIELVLRRIRKRRSLLAR